MMRMLAEEIDRRYEREVLSARLDDGTVPRVSREARHRQAADQAPVRREAIARPAGQAQAVDAGPGMKFRKPGARRLLLGDAEEALHVPAACPGQPWSGEEPEALVD